MGQTSNVEKANKGVHTTSDGNVSDVAAVSSTEAERTASIISEVCDTQKPSSIKYKKIEDTTTTTSDLAEECTTGEPCKRLYLMKTRNRQIHSSPSRIEFKLYNGKTMRGKRKKKVSGCRKSCVCDNAVTRPQAETLPETENNFLNRLKTAFTKMQHNSAPESSSGDYLDRVDIYCFDHGNFTYLRTTDCPPQILSEVLANQTTHYATRFWAEIFGSLHIGITFFVTFFMQAYRFLLYSIARPITVGFLQMTSDYFVKPILTIFFNAFLQPPLVLVYNIMSSIRDTLEPVAATIGNFLKPVATLLRSFRLVSFTTKNQVEQGVVETV